MQIRQVSLHYRPEADRISLRVNASDGAQFAVWLTRRLVLRMWPHLASMVTTIGVQREVAQATPGANVMPEARAMLADVARERALKASDFKTPFTERPTSQPLGAEPMLAESAQLTTLADGQLRLAFTDAAKRNVALQLSAEHATALRELLLQALRHADWGVAIDTAEPAPAAPVRLN